MSKPYRFMLIQAFHLPKESPYLHRAVEGPVLQKRLDDLGWEVPVLEGYSCALTLAKAMVDLKVSASGLVYPGAHPKKWRRKKLF